MAHSAACLSHTEQRHARSLVQEPLMLVCICARLGYQSRSSQALEPIADVTRSPKTGMSVAPQKGLMFS